MSVNLFTQKENILMVWDVISDEDIFKFLPLEIQGKIYEIYLNNIKNFFDIEKLKTDSLVVLNKKYILLILNHIKKTYPYIPSKIKIHNDPEPEVKELITFEEIKNSKKSQFEKELYKKQEEFEDSITIKVPPVPDFSNKQIDTPIKEMEKIIKEMKANRNYDVEQINRTYDNNSNDWLKPQQTSLKSEKFENLEDNDKPIKNNRFKFLNELDPDLLESNANAKKVSFSNNNQIKIFDIEHETYIEDEEDNNIFSKLKKVNKNENTNENAKMEDSNLSNDIIAMLNRNMAYLNEKMDNILNLLIKKE
jgi:hypothetical protein